MTHEEKQFRHPERSRRIPRSYLPDVQRDSSTALNSARNDANLIHHSCFVIDSSFVICHSSF
jgi:hypothetical protein